MDTIHTFDYFFIIYAVFIMSWYLMLAIFSAIAIKKYEKSTKLVDFDMMLGSSLLPKVSIIAPAYNEAATIVENVKSILSIKYQNVDVIIVNDGSKDETLEKLKKAYRLEQRDINYNGEVSTKKIRAIYQSQNVTTHRLLVIDKENGGKADALNAGINAADSNLVACIDVDCVLEPDSILKMVKPFLEHGEEVIAVGGAVRLANASQIVDGKLVKARIPTKMIERFQFLEYLRAFLIGRMGWSRLNGLLIVSGALGLFKRDIVLKCGGYDPNTVGEDMELVVRMRKFMHQIKKKYRVVYIPESLCWTEVPSSAKVLSRQRNRWTRGLMDTLIKHKNLFLNPKYKTMGMLSHPFWLLFEWMAPLIETVGLAYVIYKLFIHQVEPHYIVALLTLVYLFSVMISFLALFQDERTTMKFSDKRDLLHLCVTALLEPIIFHPLTVIWAIKGNLSYFKKQKSWGEMTRSGFASTP